MTLQILVTMELETLEGEENYTEMVGFALKSIKDFGIVHGGASLRVTDAELYGG